MFGQFASGDAQSAKEIKQTSFSAAAISRPAPYTLKKIHTLS